MQNMQVFYIGICVPWSFAASIASKFLPFTSPTLNMSWCVLLSSLCPCVLIVQLPLISENMWCLVFCSCVSLLRMIISSFMYVPEKDINSFFFMAIQYSIVYMCHIFFIQSIIDGNLGWFQVFAIGKVLQ